ncbi:LysR family transcriptional regulator [Paenibacillus sp. 7124]|uniref:LysR family transcriptional regulator n=2 Tax=Paenibacillus apii TaxID=1850370 RepID=A0A6M1PIU7_9BACL|nr:LysR family transcriptional regulator [Paenibacillus apii]NJJ39624.1 LysR family transcriptional regulator [Paenibacillus apii]
MTMNIVHLETFIIVCKYGNFTEAAKHLYVPQPTVTNRINQLEDELGQELFARGKSGKRNVQLTRAGERFLPHAQSVIDTLKMAKQEITHTTSLSIGSSVPLSHPLIYNVIQDLSNLNEHLNIHLIFLESSSILKALVDNVVDVAFTTDLMMNTCYQSYPLGSEEFNLILPTEHPLSNQPLLENFTCMKEENIIFYEPYKNNIADLTDLDFKKKLYSNQVEVIKSLIHEQHGVCFLPPMILEKEIKNNEMVSIPLSENIQLNKINYYLTCNKENLLKKGIRLNQDNWTFEEVV